MPGLVEQLTAHELEVLAFYGNQYGLTMPVFTHYGVQLWVYAHVMPGNQRDAAELSASLVKGGTHDGRHALRPLWPGGGHRLGGVHPRRGHG